MSGLHTTVKVVGSKCNYDCEYCFYLEKDTLLKSNKSMQQDTLEAYVRNYINSQNTPEVEFAWHGGEPTLVGLNFFEKAVEFQRKYAGQKVIKNTIQTNGSKLNNDWCRFFRENNFLVGISLDGPEWLQAKYRTKQGKSAFNEILSAIKLLQKMNVQYNVLACVTKEYCQHGEEIYTFFRKHKIKHIQFSPVVESLPSKDEQSRGQHFASNLIFSTAKSYQQNKYNPLSWAVDAKEYGKFLVDIFNLWIKEDVGKVFILNFEQALTQYIGNPSPNCIHAKNCGSSYAVEANGDVYFCDHVAYPESKIGNVMTSSFQDIASNNKDIFNKESRLSERCKKCNVRQLCNGGCPKHRYLADTGEYENVLCDGYFHFFNSIQKYLHAMTQLLANGYPASYVMQALNGPLILKSSNN
ncbi:MULTISPECIES: anaerobic sulfatase maturase [unclassified Pseudoalteromonas]|uniref:anaerobic sulfatase maturase n=1 Tax=unclassified Pseudoalteromonas TaxID=194690 RepID=UPI000C8B8793|nr:MULTISPECIES: anaerobic sulfatase maturase [unclassified Pseudoalteromonas]MAD02875.1 anaerobic sulfatase maturase [Pseudoalteromonas sp.]MCP4585683.1 anaerobic sulfatase maturase [Pseudoalteromonas sp.]RZD23067.1 anaerobic sulfatase maturase [Pseudoalteromonas sp. MEBiC 03485]URQ91766.1 anaerobic sulfatase maturase [Pseudoalteromonas sp. SCSIO 43101]|tara:strand:- start:6875 stop:8107 length:1233 start_codon:yes stop_codon:yes gene_type:complete